MQKSRIWPLPSTQHLAVTIFNIIHECWQIWVWIVLFWGPYCAAWLSAWTWLQLVGYDCCVTSCLSIVIKVLFLLLWEQLLNEFLFFISRFSAICIWFQLSLNFFFCFQVSLDCSVQIASFFSPMVFAQLLWQAFCSLPLVLFWCIFMLSLYLPSLFLIVRDLVSFPFGFCSFA